MNRQKSFADEEGAALYLVPTPIGNRQEMSPRALECLEKADWIACEDTRNSGILLKNYGIHKPLISHHEHNQESSIWKILEALKEGKKVAVISDAGYPLISDPGNYLVQKVIAQDIPVISMSGPNAATNALVASGLDTSHYLFYGFLDSKSSKRKKQLESLKTLPFTILFYEAPHRIDDMLKDLLEVFGNRQICLARELTKIHEEYLRGTIEEVLQAAEGLKGEMVVVVEGAKEEPSSLSPEEGARMALQLMEEQNLKPKEACAQISSQTGLKKNVLYSLMMELRES